MPNYRKPIPTPYREYSVPGRSVSARADRSCFSDFPIAMAYVPWQRLGKTYPLEEALNRGTLFPELYKPLTGSIGGCSHECR